MLSKIALFVAPGLDQASLVIGMCFFFLAVIGEPTGLGLVDLWRAMLTVGLGVIGTLFTIIYRDMRSKLADQIKENKRIEDDSDRVHEMIKAKFELDVQRLRDTQMRLFNLQMSFMVESFPDRARELARVMREAMVE